MWRNIDFRNKQFKFMKWALLLKSIYSILESVIEFDFILVLNHQMENCDYQRFYGHLQ